MDYENQRAQIIHSIEGAESILSDYLTIVEEIDYHIVNRILAPKNCHDFINYFSFTY